jgi:succinoglycan biosynthesis transport protein ExoP
MSSINMTNPGRLDPPIAARLGGLEYFGLRDFRALLSRRKALITAITLVVASLVSIFAHFLPNQFTASAQIMVDPGKVPESYVKSTATIDANQRLAILQEQILSDARLGQVIEELGLYRGLKANKSQDQIVEMMRQKIDISTTMTAAPAKALKAFNVSFTAPSAALAAKVANRLASLFIEENLKVREQQVTGTADFFNDQLQKAKQDLDAKSQKLQELRARYTAELPESENMHLQALTSAQLALREEGDAVNRAKQQKVYLQSLLASSPDVVDLDSSGEGANTGLEQQLEHLQAEMGQLRTHYGPSYPDVLSKAAEIQTVKEKIKQLGEQGKSAPAIGKKHHNPALEAQVGEADEEIRKHEAREAELSSKIKFHESAIERVPAVEEQLTAATNDVAAALDRYKRLDEHKFTADMFSDVEARQQGERFVLLEPAQPPENPASPNRPLLDSAGAGAGLMVSLLFVVLLEFLNPAVKTEREVLDRLKVPVFGEIPHLTVKPRRRRFWSIGATAMNLWFVATYLGLFLVSFGK